MEHHFYRRDSEYESNIERFINQGMEFEQIVREIFQKAGFEIVFNQREENSFIIEPYDIMAKKDGEIYYIEVKFSSRKRSLPLPSYKTSIKRLYDFTTEIGGNAIFVVGGLVEREDRDFLTKEQNVIVLDIANLLYAIEGDVEICNKLISFLPYSVGDILPKECMLKSEELQHSIFAESLIKKLRMIEAGRKEFGDFEDVCKDLLQYIFEDDLTLWKSQAKSNDNLFRFDCLCRIKNDNQKEFWSILEKYFETKYVVWEFKNYKDKITQKEIYTTERYLYAKALRKVAVIIAKNGYSDNALWAAKGCLRETGKLILLLDVDDIYRMFEMKKTEEDPSTYLLENLDSLLLELEK